MGSLLPISPLILLQLFILPYKGDLLFWKHLPISFLLMFTPSQEGDWGGSCVLREVKSLVQGTQLTSGETWPDSGLLSPACAPRCLPGCRTLHRRVTAV